MILVLLLFQGQIQCCHRTNWTNFEWKFTLVMQKSLSMSWRHIVARHQRFLCSTVSMVWQGNVSLSLSFFFEEICTWNLNWSFCDSLSYFISARTNWIYYDFFWVSSCSLRSFINFTSSLRCIPCDGTEACQNIIKSEVFIQKFSVHIFRRYTVWNDNHVHHIDIQSIDKSHRIHQSW